MRLGTPLSFSGRRFFFSFFSSEGGEREGGKKKTQVPRGVDETREGDTNKNKETRRSPYFIFFFI